MTNLTCNEVFTWFFEITKIPRPSKHEEKIIAFLQNFAKERSLSCKTDNAGNVLISKQASAGSENRETVVLQAHTDMVCEKNSNVDFDFSTQAIDYYVDGDWLKAHGTTLGGDNGIGIAFCLAILDSKTAEHPPLECLFTVDEETGLTGAFALKKDFLSGKTLINLDSEDDGQIFVGCAGGVNTTGILPYKTDKTPADYFAFELSVGELLGGHSGDDINKGRGNANKIINRFLWQINNETDLRLATFDGGNLHNAIPREASAIACVPFHYKEKLRVAFNIFESDVKNEFAAREPKLILELESCEIPETVMDKASSDTLLNLIYALPHGVSEISYDIAGLVETSNNLSSVKMHNANEIEIVISERSSIESAKNDIKNRIAAVFTLAGATVSHSDGYPGWKPNLNSQILKTAENAYEHLFGEKALVRAIHAGLECGLFLEKYPELDMISIGPQMYGVHSPDERLSISSTEKCWQWFLEILRTAK
ncbi:MAG: aminoacyl-histidine dipeptidase [Paludibacter sp.]|jgi:dipeptidase D|nr:aminoacyl-histidine dipeptidase [Paludibacter sp.]